MQKFIEFIKNMKVHKGVKIAIVVLVLLAIATGVIATVACQTVTVKDAANVEIKTENDVNVNADLKPNIVIEKEDDKRLQEQVEEFQGVNPLK